ncbi:Uncharacterized protein Adt_36780 [Abeliophyllum distichum]|uniref:Uncharacterized protein n=1 Tax=Abeliophyllum distichum TaxID=126358 RepID=A0ABD1QII8_9LAMI
MGPYQQTNVDAVDDLLQERYKMDQKLKESLAQERARMKHYADKNITERHFQIGYWVYLKLHPYQQQSMFQISNHGKLFRPEYLTKEVKLKLNGLYSRLTRLRRKLRGKILPSFSSNILHLNLGDKVWIRGRVVVEEQRSCNGKEERREPAGERGITSS